jgi:hypothetical protein
MHLVSTMSFFSAIQWCTLGGFDPIEGDPISPYLFLLAAEDLSCHLKVLDLMAKECSRRLRRLTTYFLQMTTFCSFKKVGRES